MSINTFTFFIGNGRGLATALALGIDSINWAHVLCATQEASVHDNVKQAIVNMKETDSTLIFRKFKNTARVFKNEIALKVQEVEKEGGEFADIHHFVSGKNQELAWTTGDVNAGMVTFGMSGGLVKNVPTCEELVKGVADDARAIISERLAAVLA